MANQILFYGSKGPTGYMSNFSRHKYKRNGRECKTSEHDYQAEKAAGTAMERKILDADSPADAKSLGQTVQLTADWHAKKEKIMLECLRAKFSQHPAIQKKLIETGDSELIENSPTDPYWGCGKNGTGKNRLGVLLMQVRDELKKK